jgi:hypothetical protein
MTVGDVNAASSKWCKSYILASSSAMHGFTHKIGGKYVVYNIIMLVHFKSDSYDKV